MEPTQELIDSIYAEKVERARATPIEQKLVSGPRLFRMGCEAMRMGIRAQNRDASEEQIDILLRERFELIKRLEEHRG